MIEFPSGKKEDGRFVVVAVRVSLSVHSSKTYSKISVFHEIGLKTSFVD